MGWLQDQFKDMSLKGQASNPLQLIINPMAAGTVALSSLKKQDDNTGWFSNMFKAKSTIQPGTSLEPYPSDPNTKYYIIGGVILVIILFIFISRSQSANA